MDARRAVVFHQDEVTAQVASSLGIILTRTDVYRCLQNHAELAWMKLDPELDNTRRKVEADDDVEGTLACRLRWMTWGPLQARLAGSRKQTGAATTQVLGEA
jgi:hypothetical protein